MCLVVFALGRHPRHRLVLAGNRDEAFARPADALGRWADAPAVVAGRDREAGGTWLGATDDGRWSVLTNVRDPLHPRPARRSRGRLPSDFLSVSRSALDYATRVHARRDAYDGFNLIVGDRRQTAVVSTRDAAVTLLGPGVYGLSNDRLDTPWPKLVRARHLLREALADDPVPHERLLDLLDDQEPAPDADLPDTGVGLALERVLSPIRIVAGEYGTRVSTALTLDPSGGGRITERTWARSGAAQATRTVTLSPAARP